MLAIPHILSTGIKNKNKSEKVMAKKKRKKRSAKLGFAPGSAIHIGEQKVKTATLDLIEYDAQKYETSELKNVEKSFRIKDSACVSWLNITGLHDTDLIQAIGKNFGIDPLVQEDILNTEHRSKIEIFPNFIFIVLKTLTYDTENRKLQKEQVSFILGRNFVITFQERPGDFWDPIRERAQNDLGRIRKNGADYLLYALMDIIIDHYFLVMENINEEIEELEEMVINNPDREQLQRIHFLKRELIEFSKAIWPVREIVNGLLREPSTLIDESIRPFWRDLYDHIINVSETIESTRDLVGGLLDTSLSQMSNRLNEVMKVLTIISTIFIPLSFLTGVYGMNFEFMPELSWRWGYLVFWGGAVILFLGMLFYFRRKKWL